MSKEDLYEAMKSMSNNKSLGNDSLSNFTKHFEMILTDHI